MKNYDYTSDSNKLETPALNEDTMTYLDTMSELSS